MDLMTQKEGKLLETYLGKMDLPLTQLCNTTAGSSIPGPFRVPAFWFRSGFGAQQTNKAPPID